MFNPLEPAFTQLDALSLLEITGADAKSFLQGQLTCSLDDVTQLISRLAGHCNLKGRLQSFMRVWQFQEKYFLTLPSHHLNNTQINLKKYAIFSKVNFNPSNLMGIGIWGENAFSLLSLFLSHLPTLNIDDCYHENHISLYRVQDNLPRYEMWLNPDVLPETLTKLKQNFKQSNFSTWEYLDIMAGVPAIYPETIDKVLPHHANLVALNAVSFNKGCYLGQEIIARMQYKGKIKKNLHILYCPVQALPGDLIANQESTSEPGLILRIAPHPQEGYVLLTILDEQQSLLPLYHLQSQALLTVI